MDDWKLEPARDLGFSGLERYRLPVRESGLVESTVRLSWWLYARTVFRLWNRLTIVGREHLPDSRPVLLVANHSSHLDALLLMSVLPLSWRDRTFPLAARDVFFERWSLAAFSAMFMNSLAVSRAGSGRRTLAAIRARIVSDGCAMILFPEGTRSRDGNPSRFKPGVGMLIAGTHVPIVPCYIEGAFAAMPPHRWFLLPRKITIHIGPPLVFSELENRRHGWDQCAARLEAAVFSLAPEGRGQADQAAGRAAEIRRRT